MEKVKIKDIIGLGFTNKDFAGYHMHLALDKNMNMFEVECDLYEKLRDEYKIKEFTEKERPDLFWQGYLNERLGKAIYDEADYGIVGEDLVRGAYEED